MKTATFTVISGNEQHTKFMQCCDVFSKSKVVGNTTTFMITFKDDLKLSRGHLNKVINRIKESLTLQGEVVTLVHLEKYQEEDIVILNEDCKIKPYFNPEVQCVSDGQTWYKFSDMLTFLNIPHIHDEHYFIKSIGEK